MKIVTLLLSLVFGAPALFSQDYNDDCLDTLQVQTAVYTKLDGYLDNFKINFACPPEDFKMTLYDRWGHEIYKTKKHDFIWTCIDNQGNRLNRGTYMWVMEYTFNAKRVVKKGQLSLTP